VKQKQEKRDKEERKKIFDNIMREVDEMRMGVTDAEFWEIVRTIVRKHEKYQDQMKGIPNNK
nr:hypothetical protein [Candidatus Sigynarchaeota archaeon]